MAKKASKASKIPDIYCRKGEPLGALAVKCNDAFGQAVATSVSTHGHSGARVYEAAEHLVRGLHHLTEVHGIELADAFKPVTNVVKTRLGMSAAALNEAVAAVETHWEKGEQLAELRLGRG